MSKQIAEREREREIERTTTTAKDAVCQSLHHTVKTIDGAEVPVRFSIALSIVIYFTYRSTSMAHFHLVYFGCPDATFTQLKPADQPMANDGHWFDTKVIAMGRGWRALSSH